MPALEKLLKKQKNNIHQFSNTIQLHYALMPFRLNKIKNCKQFAKKQSARKLFKDFSYQELQFIQTQLIETPEMLLDCITSKAQNRRKIFFKDQSPQEINIALAANISALLNQQFILLDIQMNNIFPRGKGLVRKAEQIIHPKGFALEFNWIQQKKTTTLQITTERYDPKYLYYYVDGQGLASHNETFVFLQQQNLGKKMLEDNQNLVKPLFGTRHLKNKEDFYNIIHQQFRKGHQQIKCQKYGKLNCIYQMIPVQFYSSIKSHKKQSQGYPRYKNQSLLIFKYRNKIQVIEAVKKSLTDEKVPDYSIEYPYQSSQTHPKRSIVFVSHQISAEALKKYMEINLVKIFKFTALVTLTKYLKINTSPLCFVLPFFQKFKLKYDKFPQGFALKVGENNNTATYDIFIKFQMFQQSTYSFVLIDNLRVNVWAIKERDYNKTKQDKEGSLVQILPLVEKELTGLKIFDSHVF